MEIIAKKQEILQSFWLYFWINGVGDEWIDFHLPAPTIHKHISKGKGYEIGWAIEGYFGTGKGQEFLNDIIARFLISFREQGIKRLPYKPKQLDTKTAKIYAKIYKLREFSKQLDSLPTKKLTPYRADTFADFVFWAIKLYAEDLIRQSGFVVYSALESWALSQFEHKERSTIKAKCRSVWSWYEERNWDIKKKYENFEHYMEETMATRQEHIIRLNKKIGEQNKRAVVNIITGLFADDYKKKSGAWHYGKIANQLGLTSKTVSKIIKSIEIEKIP